MRFTQFSVVVLVFTAVISPSTFLRVCTANCAHQGAQRQLFLEKSAFNVNTKDLWVVCIYMYMYMKAPSYGLLFSLFRHFPHTNTHLLFLSKQQTFLSDQNNVYMPFLNLALACDVSRDDGDGALNSSLL